PPPPSLVPYTTLFRSPCHSGPVPVLSFIIILYDRALRRCDRFTFGRGLVVEGGICLAAEKVIDREAGIRIRYDPASTEVVVYGRSEEHTSELQSRENL